MRTIIRPSGGYGLRNVRFREKKPDGRGRNAGCPAPPAQIPACAANAPGSSLGYERQSGDKDSAIPMIMRATIRHSGMGENSS